MNDPGIISVQVCYYVEAAGTPGVLYKVICIKTSELFSIVITRHLTVGHNSVSQQDNNLKHTSEMVME